MQIKQSIPLKCHIDFILHNSTESPSLICCSSFSQNIFTVLDFLGDSWSQVPSGVIAVGEPSGLAGQTLVSRHSPKLSPLFSPPLGSTWLCWGEAALGASSLGFEGSPAGQRPSSWLGDPPEGHADGLRKA